MKTLIIIALVSMTSLVFADTADTLRQAEKLNNEARAMHNAWVPTGRLIEEAKAALAAGEIDKAKAAAERALMLAKASIRQAEAERQNWKQRQPVN